MTSTWNDVRRNLTGQLRRDDYNALAHGLVTDPAPGDDYEPTEPGRAALQAWNDTRTATYPTPRT